MKRIMVHGCYNTSNFGDLLLLDLVTSHINNHSDAQVVVPWIAPSEKNNIKARAVDGIRGLGDVDKAILGGGGYFVDQPSNIRKSLKLLRYAFPALVWRIKRIPYIVVGVGVGPSLSTLGGAFVKFICNGAERICVRDLPSKEILESVGVKEARIAVAADLALCLEKAAIDKQSESKASLLVPKSTKLKIGLHFSVADRKTADVEKFATACSVLANCSDCVEVYWFFDHAENNLEAIQRIVNRTENYHLIRKQNHWTTAALIGRFDAVVTTKLHVGIVAYSLGVTPFGISSHGKTKRFFRQIDRQEFQVDYGRGFDQVNGWLADFINDRKHNGVERLSKDTELVKEKSMAAYKIISEFISE